MGDENAHPVESRLPLPDDLVQLCRELNARGAKYMVGGGFAVIQHGFLRNSGDVAVRIEDSPENQSKVTKALEVLPDQAVRELGNDDRRDWVVVRVCDEVGVDWVTRAGGVSYRDGESEIEIHTIDEAPIPFASARLLLRSKPTHRDKDAEDRAFLAAKLARQPR